MELFEAGESCIGVFTSLVINSTLCSIGTLGDDSELIFGDTGFCFLSKYEFNMFDKSQRYFAQVSFPVLCIFQSDNTCKGAVL
jgi:hypothetical protein